jgi:hypothetical protein
MTWQLIDGVVANDAFATPATPGASQLVDGLNNQAFAAPASATAQPVDPLLGLTWAASGGAPVSNGSGSSTVNAVTGTGAGSVAVTASGSNSTAAFTQAGAGAVLAQGSGGNTLASFTHTAVAAAMASGQGSNSLDAFSQSASGTAGSTAISGSGTGSISVASSGAGNVVVAGAGANTVTAFSGAGQGSVLVTGSASLTLDQFTQSGTGSSGKNPSSSGAGAVTLDGFTQDSSGTVAADPEQKTQVYGSGRKLAAPPDWNTAPIREPLQGPQEDDGLVAKVLEKWEAIEAAQAVHAAPVPDTHKDVDKEPYSVDAKPYSIDTSPKLSTLKAKPIAAIPAIDDAFTLKAEQDRRNTEQIALLMALAEAL